MIVADSTYIVEGLVEERELFKQDEDILTLDLAIYEVMNAVWKRRFLLKDLDDGQAYLSFFFEAIESDIFRIVQPDPHLIQRTYDLSAKYKKLVYDSAFVALALEVGAELKTFDKGQKRIYDSERKIRKNHRYSTETDNVS
ncbi:MAG TPA: type II toxin-antitoxin system VapC family toxin [Nitrososphaerales archaeon]|nr:type II toxin-antitoxin system VapC family toxin [Nitrososphaerales archaeon]